MGAFTIILDDNLEKRFRETIYKTKGMKRGNITKSIEEAIELWIEKMNKNNDDDWFDE